MAESRKRQVKAKTKVSTNGAIMPTMGDIQRFYALLCRVGLDEVVTAAIKEQARLSAEASKKPVTAEQQKAGGDKLKLDEQSIANIVGAFDYGKMFTVLGDNGILELVSIVCGVSQDEAADIPLETFNENFPVFAARCLQPIEQLIGLGASMT
jgi:hypothetical protein